MGHALIHRKHKLAHTHKVNMKIYQPNFYTGNIESALQSNINGLSLLKQGGEINEAIVNLQSGLQSILTFLGELEQHNQLELFLRCNRSQEALCNIRVSSEEIEIDSSLPNSDINDTFVMYSRALSIQITAVSFDFSSDDASILKTLQHAWCASRLLAFVLTYNMGLAYHLLSLQRSAHREATLSRSHKFYSVAYTSIANAEAWMIGSGSTNSDEAARCHGLRIFGLLTMAVINNLGCIQTAFCNHPEACQCSEELATRLSMVTVAQSDFHSPDFHTFYVNACFFRPELFCSAPAA